jgi:hypothetical protein
MTMPTNDDTEWLGEREVPCFTCAPDESARHVAQSLGLRIADENEVAEDAGIAAVASLPVREGWCTVSHAVDAAARELVCVLDVPVRNDKLAGARLRVLGGDESSTKAVADAALRLSLALEFERAREMQPTPELLAERVIKLSRAGLGETVDRAMYIRALERYFDAAERMAGRDPDREVP